MSAKLRGDAASSSSGRSAAVSRATRSAAASSCQSANAMRGSERCRSDASLRLTLPSSARNVPSAPASPAVPGRGRGPRNTARSSAATASRMLARVGAEPDQRMLEQREQRHRRQSAECGIDREPRKRTGRRGGQRVAAGIVDRHLPALQRREHAARQRAVGRHQRGGLARRLGGFAQRDRDRQRLLVGIRGFEHGQRGERAVLVRGKLRIGKFGLPAVGGSRRAQGFRHQPLAAMRRRRAENLHLVARNPDPAQQSRHRKLRMTDRRRDRLVAGRRAAFDHAPGRVIEIGVEPRQHHRAMRQPGDGGDQFGGRRHRAGRSGGDHRPVALHGEPFRLGGDQQVAARRRLDPAVRGEQRGPGLARDLEEPQRQLASSGRIASGTSSSSRSHGTCRVAMSSISRARSSASASAAAGELATSGAPVAVRTSGAVRPLAHQFGEQHAPLEPAEALGQRERIGGKLARRHAGERDLVLVDVAERDDARQDRGVTLEQIEKAVAHQPAGAPGRQIERRVRERERIAGGGEAFDQPAGRQRAEQRRHERHRCRDGEDSGERHAESYTTGRRHSATGACGCTERRGKTATPRWRRWRPRRR